MQKNLYRFSVDGISTELPTIGKCKKAMQLKLERELDLHAGKSEPRDMKWEQLLMQKNFESDG